MSSMALKTFAAALALSVSSAAIAQNGYGELRPVEPRPAFGPRADGSVSGTLANWRRLGNTGTASFGDYASFLIANPGWPGEDSMRKAAENAIIADITPPTQVTGYFARLPATTTTGEARHALALLATGDRLTATAAARRAWHGGALGPQDEARLLAQFGSSFTQDDHDRRMDRLLWDNATQSASRQIAWTSLARRAGFEARLALQNRAADAPVRVAALDSQARNDPGLIVDRAGYLRKSGASAGARQLLAARRQLVRPPLDAEEWLETLLTNARGAANDGQWSLVYDIARQVDDAYAPGVKVSDRPIGERDDYTSLVWLGGTTALKQRGRPADAIPLFERYAAAARSPQTQSKGYYWAGRAAQAAGRAPQATGYFERAAAFADYYYGQLALERLGRPIVRAPVLQVAAFSPAERQAWQARSVVRATRALGSMGAWTEQTQFLRALAQEAKTPGEHYFAAELAREIRRPDFGVMIGRSASVNDLSDPLGVGFPTVPLPSGYERDFTMIHAITRQESQFDRMALSHAGARGLMQLMPGTARETAGKIGLGYDISNLTADPLYNIRLGATYFQNMLSYFGGSYPLAVAAYNAGPGNVNKWLRANGDPRRGGVDVIDWVEAIPLYETRNYVQRVLENAVVYDAIRPERARTRGSRAPLSWYLGKRSLG